jgi:hypothetical protein
MHKFFSNIKNYNKGITIIEIIVVIFIVTLFSVILISNFPKILRQFALSRVTYKLSQDLRKTQDLGLSGVVTNDGETTARPIITLKGYGVYINATQPATQYIIYADLDNSKTYNPASAIKCSDEPVNNPTSDCIIETIDVSIENPSLYIKSLSNVTGNITSINFTPPDPIININNIVYGNSKIGITIGLTSDPSASRTVWINTSGLIEVQ